MQTARNARAWSPCQTFVLIHGSWHDGSAWNKVIERLNRHGHRAFGPTVAGHGKGVDKNVSHAQSSQSIVDFIVRLGLTDIVLVGHSYGGTIISKVVEAIPDHVRRLVFWSGFILNDGESLNDAVPPIFASCFAAWPQIHQTTASCCRSRSGVRHSSTTPIWTLPGGPTTSYRRSRISRSSNRWISRSSTPWVSGIDSLTPTELRVAQLAARGGSNRDIAEMIFVSRNIVAWHLRNVYRKLQIDSREQLARVVEA
jgi:DNA-binding CsgD family transcriptional regulator